MSEPLEQTLTERLAAERMLRDGGAPSGMLDMVDLALAEAGVTSAPRVAAAARGLLDTACVIRHCGQAARDFLGVPDDGRTTAFAIWEHSGPVGAVAVSFDFHASRRAAATRFAASSGVSETCLGLRLPQEALDRLRAARGRPSLAEHFTLTAADHMAAHAMELAAGIEGACADGQTVLWTGSFPEGDFESALAWLFVPGPGAFAASVSVFMPRAAEE